MKYKRIIATLIILVLSCCCLFAKEVSSEPEPAAKGPAFTFDNYWMTGFTTGYAPNLNIEALTGMKNIIVSFANIFNGKLVIMDEGAPQAVPFTEKQYQDLKAKISDMKRNGINAWIALGGAVGPYIWSDESITENEAVEMIAELASEMGFIGIDFDYEAYDHPDRLYNIIKLISERYSSLELSFTFASMPCGGTITPSNGIPGALTDIKIGGENLFSALWPYLSSYNYMNYNQGSWCPPNTSMTDMPSKGEAPYQETGYWNKNFYVNNFYYAVRTIAKLTGKTPEEVGRKFMSGINIGYDGVNKVTISPELAAALTQEAKNQGLKGVFTWCLNRDYPGSGYKGDNSGTDNPVGSYSNAIANAVSP
jgi:chitinase